MVFRTSKPESLQPATFCDTTALGSDPTLNASQKICNREEIIGSMAFNRKGEAALLFLRRNPLRSAVRLPRHSDFTGGEQEEMHLTKMRPK